MTVSRDDARRIAVRAQLLDGSATTVLDTVRRLGFLQIDPISTVAPPQHLVLWSRLDGFEAAELDRLLWVENKLFEWNAYVWPIDSLPLIQARMRRHRTGRYASERRGEEFLRTNTAFKRLVLRELEQNGPMLSRDRGRRGPNLGIARLVREPERRRAARGPALARSRGRRGAAKRAARVGSRGALVSAGGEGLAP